MNDNDNDNDNGDNDLMTPLESANSPKENFDLSSECGTEKCKSKTIFFFFFTVADFVLF